MLKIVKRLAFVLAICLLAGGCSLIEVNPDRQVVAKVKDREITLATFRETAEDMFYYYQVDPNDPNMTDYVDQLSTVVLESLVAEQIQLLKVAELGLDKGEADIAEAQAKVDSTIAEQKASYKESLLASGGEEMTEEEADRQAEEMTQGAFTEEYTREMYRDELLEQIQIERLREESTKDVAVTDEEVNARYTEQLTTDQETYTTDKAAYVTALEGGETPLFAPEGIYYVKHILIQIPEEKQQEIASLRGEDKADEAEALLQAELALIQPRADEALAKVQAGDDFDALVAEYGEDPGMKQEPGISRGYVMYEGVTTYVQPFTDAGVALTADGQTSGLVPTDFGFHILKRVSTVPSGATPYEEVQETLRETMLTAKKDETYTSLLQQWSDEYGAQYYENRISFE